MVLQAVMFLTAQGLQRVKLQRETHRMPPKVVLAEAVPSLTFFGERDVIQSAQSPDCPRSLCVHVMPKRDD